jgi:hypothetical protein
VIYGLIESLWSKDLNYGENFFLGPVLAPRGGFSRVPSQSQILGIDPALGQEDLKSLTSYICMNICEYFIHVCVKEKEREFVCMCVQKMAFACLCICISHYYEIVRVCV